MPEKGKKRERAPLRPAEAVHTLTDLEQVRVLADPLRVRIIEVLCEHEATTKQVAERIGEKPTKLYHHVEALERVGLIRLTRTRQNRGTLEKYYIAIARAFRSDASIFAGPEKEAAGEALRSVVSTILDNTAAELKALVRQGETGGGAAPVTEEGVLSYLELHFSDKDRKRIQRRIQRLLKDLQADVDVPEPGAGRRFRLTLAFYPLDRPEDAETADS